MGEEANRSDRNVPIEEYFADTAEDYDSWYETRAGAFADRVETELAFALLPPEPGQKVLDAGCGTGNFTFKLARSGCRVTGVDVSEEMLDIARDKLTDFPHAHRVNFRCMDFRDLQFPPGSFDRIYSMAAFEFVQDRKKTFYDLYRTLKPGGSMLIGTIQGKSSWAKFYRRRAAENPDSVFAHARFPTREKLEAINQKHLVGSGECLFIPPDAPPEVFTPQEERRRRGEGRGGFFCVVWQKPKKEGER